MLVTSDGYIIEHYRKSNQIIITMPQTTQTLSDTASVVRNQKVDFTDSDLVVLLGLVKYICERGDRE